MAQHYTLNLQYSWTSPNAQNGGFDNASWSLGTEKQSGGTVAVRPGDQISIAFIYQPYNSNEIAPDFTREPTILFGRTAGVNQNRRSPFSDVIFTNQNRQLSIANNTATMTLGTVAQGISVLTDCYSFIVALALNGVLNGTQSGITLTHDPEMDVDNSGG